MAQDGCDDTFEAFCDRLRHTDQRLMPAASTTVTSGTDRRLGNHGRRASRTSRSSTKRLEVRRSESTSPSTTARPSSRNRSRRCGAPHPVGRGGSWRRPAPRREHSGKAPQIALRRDPPPDKRGCRARRPVRPHQPPDAIRLQGRHDPTRSCRRRCASRSDTSRDPHDRNGGPRSGPNRD